MSKHRYHSQPLFEGLDPPEIGYEDQLSKDGKRLAIIHSEYAVKNILHEADKLTIVLRKVWTDGSGQPLEGLLTLYFEPAKVTASPINEPTDRLEAIAELRDLRPFTPSPAEQAQGYKGLELSTNQGLWDILFSKARAAFEPPVQPS